MMWTYMQTQTSDEPCGEMYTVGYYTDQGEWVAESDWGSVAEAADRVALLAGEDGVMRPRPGHPVPEALFPSMT
jgi:hypothetical protein